MTLKERQRIAKDRFAKCAKLLMTKGKDYAGDQDALSNFKGIAHRLGISKYQVWSVYFMKHVRAIINSIKANPENPQVESEPLEERITDVINYAVLLEALLKKKPCSVK